jgi:hypothetical protein
VIILLRQYPTFYQAIAGSYRHSHKIIVFGRGILVLGQGILTVVPEGSLQGILAHPFVYGVPFLDRRAALLLYGFNGHFPLQKTASYYSLRLGDVQSVSLTETDFVTVAVADIETRLY